MVVAIDPGKSGAIVLVNGNKLKTFTMPLGPDKSLDFEELVRILLSLPDCKVYVEKAKALAMGSKHAFNYGMDFKAILIALEILERPYQLIEPSQWSKQMHQGINSDLKPKAKSLIAIKRLFPKLVSQIPTTPRAKKLHDGVVDAVLIAGYAQKYLRA